MTGYQATIRNHWRGTTYVLEEELRPGFLRAAVVIETDHGHEIARVYVNSARVGTAEWRPGHGLTATTRWESEAAATAGGGWAGMLPCPLATRGDERSAWQSAADALAHLPLRATRYVVLQFIATARQATHVLTGAAIAEFAALAAASEV